MGSLSASATTMEGAKRLGSILRGAVDNPERKQAFQGLMQGVMDDAIKATVGQSPTWHDPTPAPESRAGGASIMQTAIAAVSFPKPQPTRLCDLPETAAPAEIAALFLNYEAGFLDDVAAAVADPTAYVSRDRYDGELGNLVVEWDRGGAHMLPMASTDQFLRLGLVNSVWPTEPCDCCEYDEPEWDEDEGRPYCTHECLPAISISDLGKMALAEYQKLHPSPLSK